MIWPHHLFQKNLPLFPSCKTPVESLCKLEKGTPSSRWTHSWTRVLAWKDMGLYFIPLVSLWLIPLCCEEAYAGTPAYYHSDTEWYYYINLPFRHYFPTTSCQTKASVHWSTYKSSLSHSSHIWKQCKCLLMDKWIRKCDYIYVYMYIWNIIHP